MAGPLICDLCETPADPVIFLVTRTDNGDTITLGAGCMPAWAMAVVESLTGPPEPDGADEAASGGQEAAQEATDGTTPPPARGGRSRSKSKAPETAAATQEAQAAAE